MFSSVLKWSTGTRLAQLVEQRPMYRGCVLTAVAQGSSPGLGPFAACHPSLSLPVSCHIFSCSVNKGQKSMLYTKVIHEFTANNSWFSALYNHTGSQIGWYVCVSIHQMSYNISVNLNFTISSNLTSYDKLWGESSFVWCGWVMTPLTALWFRPAPSKCPSDGCDIICWHHSPDSLRGSSLNSFSKHWPQTSPAVPGGPQNKFTRCYHSTEQVPVIFTPSAYFM